MGFAEIILVLSIVPLDMPITESVESLEINHFHDDEGKHVFDQAIIRQWNPHTCRDEIRCWWLIREHDHPSGDWLRMDGRDMRRVKAGRVWESWTQHDPELVERVELPTEQRRGLIKFFKE